MASKLQQYFVSLINLQRQIDALSETHIESKDLMDLADLRGKYILWLGDIREEKEFEKFGSLHANDSAVSDLMNNGGVGTIDRYFDIKKLLQKEIILRLDFLSKLEITPIKNLLKEDNKSSITIPAGTMWENFIIKFIDDQKVLIEVVGKKEEADYKKMGFEDNRQSKPDSQWVLLKLLSSHNGELSWNNNEAEEKIKKIKERLSKQLKNYFSIDYDPFYPYKNTKSYKIKITLIPLEKEIEENISNETQDYFDGLIVDDI